MCGVLGAVFTNMNRLLQNLAYISRVSAYADVSFSSCLFPFSDVLIFVLFFVQATNFNERNAFLVAFQVLYIYYVVILCYYLENKF